MAFLVDKMLENLIKSGVAPEELKGYVIAALEPYFENKSILNSIATHDQILSIFSYIILYHKDNSFGYELENVINLYREAYSINSKQVKDIILSTANLMGQKENLMWTVKSNTPNEVSEDIHEATYSYMKHIGDCLEIGLKYRIIELYAIIETSYNNEIRYDSIINMNFGTAIQNIVNKNKFVQILKPEPISIKLSDWRNIAYHHTYEIEGESIKCNYGKNGNNFVMFLNELHDYAGKIIKSCNIIDIGRRIFLFDNNNIFSELNEENITIHDREAMKIGQLRTSMLSQGFKLVDFISGKENVKATIWDIKRNNLLTDDAQTRREIHCTQFLYNIWIEFPVKIINIIYCDSMGKKLYEYSTKGEMCQKIANGTLEFVNLFGFISIKKLLN